MGESATTSADLDPPPSRRNRRARVRRRTHRAQTAMVALVAVVVALTILIFFALGYAFGRTFL